MQDIVQKEKVQEIVMETTLEVRDIVHNEELFRDSQDHNEENFHDVSQEQVLDDEVFEEVEEVAVHAQGIVQRKRKLSVSSDASSNKHETNFVLKHGFHVIAIDDGSFGYGRGKSGCPIPYVVCYVKFLWCLDYS